MGPENLLSKKQTKEREHKAKREMKETVFIYTEGTKTEPQYFQALTKDLGLDNSKKYTITIRGTSDNTDRIVEEAKKQIDKSKDSIDHLWCVFDKDSFPKNKIGRAYDLIKGKKYTDKIKIAFSNECFELWYLLHFIYWNTANPRKDYYKKLTKILGFQYVKNNPNMYEILKDKMNTAFKNSQRLKEQYHSNKKFENNPYTDVDELIKWLKTLPE